MFDYLANPARFMRIADRLFWPLVAAAGGLIAAGLYFGLFASPITPRRVSAAVPSTSETRSAPRSPISIWSIIAISGVASSIGTALMIQWVAALAIA